MFIHVCKDTQRHTLEALPVNAPPAPTPDEEAFSFETCAAQCVVYESIEAYFTWKET